MKSNLICSLFALWVLWVPLHGAGGDAAAYGGPKRINKVIELLEAGQPVYYTYGARGTDPARTSQEMFEQGHSIW